MKIYGLQGPMTGKIGNTVMAVRNGVQIGRQYQKMVYNPSTARQVEVRAKLKLLSQLSAVFANVIAIPREGLVSPRNLFVKDNFPKATYTDDEADIVLTDIELTRSAVDISGIAVASRTADTLNVRTNGDPSLSRVVYVAVGKSGNKLLYRGSQVVSEPAADNTWPTSFPIVAASDIIVYAYGIRDNSEEATARYGNLLALSAEQVAKIIVDRTLTESDITVTRTVAVESAPQA